MIFEYLKNAKDGKIKAGLTRLELRKIFNSEVQEFKKTPLCKNTTDAFYEMDIHAFYDEESDLLEGLEIFQPNRIIYNKDIILLQNDLKLLRIKIRNCNEKLNIKFETTGINIDDNKLGVYIPHADENCAECACVYVDLKKGCSLNIVEK